MSGAGLPLFLTQTLEPAPCIYLGRVQPPVFIWAESPPPPPSRHQEVTTSTSMSSSTNVKWQLLVSMDSCFLQCD